MEPKDVFKDDMFQKTATTFVPGVLAFAPYAAIMLRRYPSLLDLLKASPVLTGAAIVAMAILGGMVCENLGSWIELLIWRRLRKHAVKKQRVDPEIEWLKYLELSDADGIVGQGYLEALCTRLKFELAMMPALVFFAVGLHILNEKIKFLKDSEHCLACVIFVISVAYFVVEASATSKLLISVRATILNAKNNVKGITHGAG